MVMREGRVLVKMPYVIKESVKVGDVDISLVSKASETKYDLGCRHGEVVSIPSVADIPHLNYAFKSKVEVEPGDTVWWSKNAIGNVILQSKNQTIRFSCEGVEYYIMHYNELLLRKRGDDFLSLNDRIIARVVLPEAHPLFDLSFTSMAKPLKDKFDVVYTPSFDGHYLGNRTINKCSAGDRVFVSRSGSVSAPLEDEMNNTLEKGLVYFRSSDISGII